LYLGSNFTKFIILLTPQTKNILKIFEPIIFQIAISFCHFKTPIKLATSSGKEVQIATIVAHTKNILTPNF